MSWLHLEVDVNVPDDIEDDALALFEAFHDGIPADWPVNRLTIWPGDDSEPVIA